MKKNRLFKLAVLAGSMIAMPAMAQEDTTKCSGSLQISGSADAYYQTLLAGKNPANFGLLNRAFDSQYDQFAFNQLQTNLVYTNDKIEIVAQTLFGPGAGVANFNNANNTPAVGVLGSNYLAVKQAYGKWKATDKLALTIGQFGTHIGYELIDAPLNFHYSVSNLFQNGPYYHTGAKLDFQLTEKFAVMAGLVNGWDNANLGTPSFDNNKQKSFIGQLALKPNDVTGIYFNYIGGKEEQISGKTNTHTFDLVATTTLNDKFTLGMNAVYGLVEDGRYKTGTLAAIKAQTATVANPNGDATAGYGGIAAYASVKLSDILSLGARLEHYENYFGVRTQFGRSNNAFTLTAPITLASGHFILKPEYRQDWNLDRVYTGYDGRADFRQGTVGVAAIYKF